MSKTHAQSRQERLEARLRGAGTRRVEQNSSLDFDTNLGLTSDLSISGVAESDSDLEAAAEQDKLDIVKDKQQGRHLNANPPRNRKSRTSKLQGRIRGAANRNVREISSFQANSSGFLTEMENTGLEPSETPHSTDNYNTDDNDNNNSYDNDDDDIYDPGYYASDQSHQLYDDDDLDQEPTIGSTSETRSRRGPAEGDPSVFLNSEAYATPSDYGADLYDDDLYDDTVVESNKRKFDAPAPSRTARFRKAAPSSRPVVDPDFSEDEDGESAVGEKITIEIQKVPVEYGGTNKVNAADIVADAVDRLLERSAAQVSGEDWVPEAMVAFREEVQRRFAALSDIVDVNAALASAAKRSTSARNNLRLRLLAIKQQREDVLIEINKAREEHRQIMQKNLSLRAISKFVEDAGRKPLGVPAFSKTNLEADLMEIEPMFGKGYGTLDRVRTLNARMRELLASSPGEM